MTPHRAIIPELDYNDDELIIAWGFENEMIVHDLAIKAAVELHKNGKPNDFIVIIEFFSSMMDLDPFADILVDYDEIETVLDDAEDYYVRVEEYEKAAEVKTIRESMNIKNKQDGK